MFHLGFPCESWLETRFHHLTVVTMLPAAYIPIIFQLWAVFAYAARFDNPHYVAGKSEVWYVGQTQEVTYNIYQAAITACITTPNTR